MKQPLVLDGRDRADIMAEIAAHAREYTPEWRYEGAEDDPGAALAALFGEMFYQTVDRMNAVPQKLHTEFLNLVGFQMPAPAPAAGLIQFTAHDTVSAPVPVPAGTQVFTRDEDGENVIYETERMLEATPARLTGLFYVDPRAEWIQRLDPAGPNRFFAPDAGENLQRHRFSFGQDDVLALSGPCEVEVEVSQQAEFTTAETAARLADPALACWSFCGEEGETPFGAVRAEGNTLFLEYAGPGAFVPDERGRYSVTCTCTGPLGSGTLVLDGIRLRSRPGGPLPLDSVANGDVDLDLEGGDYCLGRRPAPYSLCYFRSDQAFRKRGARVCLRLDIAPVVEGPAEPQLQYDFHQRVIDKRDAVAVRPDDVYVSQVTWEYFNGLGWRALAVSGRRNPFSCKTEGPLEVVFDVPEDLSAAVVNAQQGYYIRARVVAVENQFSLLPRWLIPFLRGAECLWSYDRGRPVDWCRGENNGGVAALEEAAGIGRLGFPAVTALEEHPKAMYFCFDRSPHAMPLAIRFDVAGRVELEDALRFEAWTGERFEPVRTLDLSRNLLRTGVMRLYLTAPLARRTLFGTEGYWLRLCRSSYLENRGGYPVVNAIRLNTVTAVQRERVPEEAFSTGPYEANKVLELLRRPVLAEEVWVDEAAGLTQAEAEELSGALPGRVRLEQEDHVLTRCWVLWERVGNLALCGPEDRCYYLDPYGGIIRFGDGILGRVPPQGEENIRVRYFCGGGPRGNRPAGSITAPVGALPRISRIENLTPMSGGTGRFPTEKAERLGNRHLRHQGRAAGPRDFEDIVALEFPQAKHVKCFPGRDGTGEYAPGHVCVVVEGWDPEDPQVTSDLCIRIEGELSRRCDCVLAAEGRLHVVGSTVLTVNSHVTVELEDLDQGAVTQAELVRRLEELIGRRWREEDIGSQLHTGQVWQTVRETPNVRTVRSVLLEGRYNQGGRQRVVALEADGGFPFATVKSGVHLIQIE